MLLVIALIPLLASGCSAYTDPGKGRLLVPLPDIDPRDRAPCPDPGVDENKTVAVAENRVLAACERKKKENVIALYDGVRSKYNPE